MKAAWSSGTTSKPNANHPFAKRNPARQGPALPQINSSPRGADTPVWMHPVSLRPKSVQKGLKDQ